MEKLDNKSVVEGDVGKPDVSELVVDIQDIGVPGFGNYITYQCGILNTILGFLSYDELNNVQLVCKEWLRAIKMIKQKQNHFMTTIFYFHPSRHGTIWHTLELSMTNIKLHTGCLSLLLSSDYTFEKMNSLEIINDHLLEIHEYEGLRIFSGNYLPLINIFNNYNHPDIISTALTTQRIYSKLGDISIYQCHKGFNTNNLKQFLTNLKKPIKSIMVFKENQYEFINNNDVMVFQKVVQEIQVEPFTMIGAVTDYYVLLPTSIANSVDSNKGRNDNVCTFVVFSGDLKVTSMELEENELYHNNFERLIDNLYNKVGVCSINNTRIIYIFTYSTYFSKTIFDLLLARFPTVEIVFIKSMQEVIYFDSLHQIQQDAMDYYDGAIIFSVFDFKDCSYDCKYEDLLM